MQIESIADQLGYVIRKINSEWIAERDSDPMGIEEAKLILSDLRINLTEFSCQTGVPEDDRALMQNLILKARKLERHQVFLDGMESFNEFFRLGDALMEEADAFYKKIKTEI